MNPWHDVSPGKLAPKIVQVIVEIPKGSRAKYEIDKETGLLKLDRVLYASMYYPANYGFIPQTLCGDGDPLDILVISQINFEPRCLVRAIPIGVMRMQDKGQDDKIVAVCADDISVAHIDHIDDLPLSFKNELLNFFEEYKKLEGHKVLISPMEGAAKAAQIIMESIDLYNKEVKPRL